MEKLNNIIINTIEALIKKYLKTVSYDREGMIRSIDSDGKLCIFIDKHEYKIKNGTGINFSAGDKCLIHYPNGNENKKLVIAKLFDGNRKVTKDQLDISDVAFSGSYTDLKNKPTAMKNPYKYSANGKTYDGSSTVDMGTMGVAYGGTGATNAADARTNLGVAATVHAHDERYYTEAETNALLSGKAPSEHKHSAGDINSGTLPITRGGTGATDITNARTNLGLGASATNNVANNLTTTAAGSVLDARQGKVLKDTLDSYSQTTNNSIGTLTTRVNECFQSVSNGKALVAAAISGKGISTAANATYQQMANNIGQIETSSNGALNFTCSGGDSHTEHHGSFKVYNAKKIIVNSVSARNDMKKEVRWSSNFGFNYSDSSRTIDKSFGTEYNTSGINPVTININGNCGNDSSISIHAYY